VLVGGVVGHEVDQHPQPAGVRRGQQPVEVGEGAEHRVDHAMIGDVVAEVDHRRGVERRQPDRIHSEVDQVVQPAGDPGQVPDPVAAGVGEAPRIDLIDHRRPPPVVSGEPSPA